MRKHIITGLLSLSALLMAGCADNLDIQQNGSTSLNDFYQTDAEVEEATTAIYAQFRSMLRGRFTSTTELKLSLSDEVYIGGSTRGDNLGKEQLNEYRYDHTNEVISSVFENLYTLLYRANLVINKVDPSGSNIKKRDVAEALVFRAWANFELVTLWGPAPLVLEAQRSDYKAGNSTVEAIWAQVEADLNQAISMDCLNEKQNMEDNISGIRVTKQFAQALLGKAYIFQGKYAEAIQPLQEIVNSGLYGFLEDYENYCVATYNNNREIIFSDNVANTIQDASSCWLWLCCGWSSSYLTGLSTTSADINSMGWGQFLPTPASIQAFIDMEGEDGFRFKGTMKSYNDLLDMGISLINGQAYYASSGYFNWKYRAPKLSLVNPMNPTSLYNNIPFMKYSEVILLLAEAKIMTDGDGAGDTELNMIRRKAHLPELSNAGMDELKAEKRLELYMDGTRYQDLIRWGDAATVMAEQGKQIPAFNGLNPDGSFNVTEDRYTNTEYGFKKKHYLLPFPEAEININPNINQNPEW